VEIQQTGTAEEESDEEERKGKSHENIEKFWRTTK
jgi:hypothetical protein